MPSAPAVSQANVQKDIAPKKLGNDAKNLKYPFWFGGSAAAMSAAVTHPLDLGRHSSVLDKQRLMSEQ